MDKRINILVAYVSGYGATAGVAKEIGEVFNQLGAKAEVTPIKNLELLEKYDAVIVGSAIQYDRWMPDARRFVTTNQELLSQVQVAYFFTCLALSVDNGKTRQQANKYSDKIKALSSMVNPVSVGQFAGAVNFTKMPFFLRQLFKLFSKISGVKEGDYRDWNAVRAWAKDVYTKMNLENKA